MDTDTDSVVYFISRYGFAFGFVKYGDGEFYSDEHDFQTNSKTQSGSVKQLAGWMIKMEKDDFVFKSVEQELNEYGS